MLQLWQVIRGKAGQDVSSRSWLPITPTILKKDEGSVGWPKATHQP